MASPTQQPVFTPANTPDILRGNILDMTPRSMKNRMIHIHDKLDQYTGIIRELEQKDRRQNAALWEVKGLLGPKMYNDVWVESEEWNYLEPSFELVFTHMRDHRNCIEKVFHAEIID